MTRADKLLEIWLPWYLLVTNAGTLAALCLYLWAKWRVR